MSLLLKIVVICPHEINIPMNKKFSIVSNTMHSIFPTNISLCQKRFYGEWNKELKAKYFKLIL